MTGDNDVGRLHTGIEGLDEVLSGGFLPDRLYLVEGTPGTGKTTVAMQFLLEGARQGEKGLYITLSETEEELRHTARSHGWDIPSNIEIFELLPPENLLDEQQHQSLLYSSDLELGETTKLVFEAIQRVKPDRLVLDSLSEIRLLAQNSLRYRRQVLSLKHYFAKHKLTVLMLDDLTSELNDKTVHSVSHGVLRLEELAPLYGAERRRMRVMKYRASGYRGGYHDLVIKRGGVSVFPRLRSIEHRGPAERGIVHSGIANLDALLGGGIKSGSSTLIIGPAGAGKSLVAMCYAVAAVKRGEVAALFVFDEELSLLQERYLTLGVDVAALQATGRFFIEQLDAAELSPGEFIHRVRKLVDAQSAKTVIIDSLNGFQMAMPEEQFLVLQVHELLQYLNRQGVTTFVTVAQHGLVGEMSSPVDVTYLADSVLLMRYFEANGMVRRAISVIKKRTGVHELSIREYTITGKGLSIGEPLHRFQGVLRGVPSYMGPQDSLFASHQDATS